MSREYVHDVFDFMYAGRQFHSLDRKDLRALYKKLVEEEIAELATATPGSADHLDAIIDSVWVLIGLAHAHGYDFQGAWDAVQHANMAKLGQIGAAHVRADGKIQKPARWKRPDLRKFTRGG